MTNKKVAVYSDPAVVVQAMQKLQSSESQLKDQVWSICCVRHIACSLVLSGVGRNFVFFSRVSRFARPVSILVVAYIQDIFDCHDYCWLAGF